MSESSPSNNDPQSSSSQAEPASDGSADSNNGSSTSSEQASAADRGAAEDSTPEPSAVDDLASGLGFMFRAAKKAVRSLDPQKIEALGREAAERASKEVDKIDREKVNEFGRKAAETLKPERIEKAAEDAGRELLNVVERVADRMEQALGSKTGASKPGAPGSAESAGAADAPESSRREPAP